MGGKERTKTTQLFYVDQGGVIRRITARPITFSVFFWCQNFWGGLVKGRVPGWRGKTA